MQIVPSACVLALSLSTIGCGSGNSRPTTQPSPATPSTPTTPSTPMTPATPSGRATMTAKECDASGGGVVGDIGDGATQRPNYVCASGKPPTANIVAEAGGPMGVEGAVCCPK